MNVLRLREPARWVAVIASLCASVGMAIAGGTTFADRFSALDGGTAEPLAYSPAAVPSPTGLGGFLTSNAYAAVQNPKDLTALGVRAASGAVRKYLLPALGEGAPGWAKRIEFEFDVQKDLKPTYSILTVQPLYQSKDKQNTVFVQASQLRYDLLENIATPAMSVSVTGACFRQFAAARRQYLLRPRMDLWARALQRRR